MFCKKCGSEIAQDARFCPNCGEPIDVDTDTYLPRGKGLLDGLYIVQDFLLEANEKMDTFFDLERYYRKTKKEFKTESVVEKGQYGLFTMGLSFSLVSLIPCLLTGNIEGILIGGLASFLFWKGKMKENKKLLYIGLALLAFLAFTILSAIPRGFALSTAAGVGAILIYGTALIACFIVAKRIVNKHNAKINNYNALTNANNSEIDRRRQDLMEEINSLLSEMQSKTASWFPTDYYAIEAVNAFIKLVKNHEADTVKEMVSIFKKDKFRMDVITNFNVMNQKLEQSLNNQDKMIALQKTSNMLLMGNLITNMVTASRVGEVAANTRTMSSDLHSVSSRVSDVSRKVDNVSGQVSNVSSRVGDVERKINR